MSKKVDALNLSWVKECEICNAGLCARMHMLVVIGKMGVSAAAEVLSDESGNEFSGEVIRNRYNRHAHVPKKDNYGKNCSIRTNSQKTHKNTDINESKSMPENFGDSDKPILTKKQKADIKRALELEEQTRLDGIAKRKRAEAARIKKEKAAAKIKSEHKAKNEKFWRKEEYLRGKETDPKEYLALLLKHFKDINHGGYQHYMETYYPQVKARWEKANNINQPTSSSSRSYVTPAEIAAWKVLGIETTCRITMISSTFKAIQKFYVKSYHPDSPDGDANKMVALNNAIDTLRKSGSII